MPFNPRKYYAALFNDRAKTFEDFPRWNVKDLDDNNEKFEQLVDACYEQPQVIEDEKGAAFAIPYDTYERLQNNGSRLQGWHVGEVGEFLEEIARLTVLEGPQMIFEESDIVFISREHLDFYIDMNNKRQASIATSVPFDPA